MIVGITHRVSVSDVKAKNITSAGCVASGFENRKEAQWFFYIAIISINFKNRLGKNIMKRMSMIFMALPGSLCCFIT